MDGTETGRQQPARPGRSGGRRGFGRFTRQEAVLGLAALGLFYWGSVATLVSYRLERTQVTAARCSVTSPTPRGPRLRRIHPQLEGPMNRLWLPPEPAWAPYPRPRPLGLAWDAPEVVLVDTGASRGHTRQ